MEEVDSEGPVLRARVSIDITKSLCRGLKILIDDSNELVTIPIQYEYLPDFCYRCEIIGHKIREYPMEAVVDNDGNLVSPKYGDWLKAFNLKQWRKERREKKSSPQWSDSSTSSGKSSGSRGGVHGSEFKSMELALECRKENLLLKAKSFGERRVVLSDNTLSRHKSNKVD
ncbi:Zinc knuckle CX2CX4HX4C [Trema orientale]|uniref:Zinc knuckle CX2CX4HX4C n=1 Tax=Trema orientale TaxID=63057 RepID=A0A2P5D8A9_TREOI|nr:Zinc knuckle CX2CX4HX4C [Trema orientale]